MRRLALAILFCAAAAWAQPVYTPGLRAPCTATRTTGCTPQIDANGNLSVSTTVLVSASSLSGTAAQNRDALQAILTSNVGKTIVLPNGVFSIAPISDKTKFFTLPAGTRLRGTATLKVADSTGPYDNIFYSSDCSGCDLRDFTVDANVAGNAIVNNAEILAHPRHEFLFIAGSNVSFHSLTVKNSSATQSIMVDGETGGTVQNVTVENCSFLNMGDDPNHIVHDVSTLFVWGVGAQLSGNQFYAASVGAPGAYTAIEVHGSSFGISRNIIRDYANGFNICGRNTDTTMADAITVTGNSVAGALYGLTLYTGGVVISGNTFRINQTSYVSATWGDYTQSYGISVPGNLPTTLQNVMIASNTIVFDVEATDRPVNTATVGIGWVSSLSPAWGVVNFSVISNIIDNCPLSAIRFSVAAADGLKIANNSIRNAGQSLHAVSQGYKTPIFLYSSMGPLVGDVSGNTIIDDQEPTRMVNAILLGSVVTGHDIKLRDNAVNLLGATKTAFLSYISFTDANTVPYLREAWANFGTAKTSQPVAVGSRVFDISSNITWVYATTGWTTDAKTTVIIPTSDAICALGGDTSISGVTCTNGSGSDAAGTRTPFATVFSVPAGLITVRKALRITASFSVWSTSTPDSITDLAVLYGAVTVTNHAGTMAMTPSQTNFGASTAWLSVGTVTLGTITSEPLYLNIPGWTAANTYNTTAQPTIVGVNAMDLKLAVKYASTGVSGATGTYTYSSGLSACSDGTRVVTFTNGGGTGAIGSITVTSGIPTGAVTITNTGMGYTSQPTTATVATCTGTGTFTTTGVLGGAQGNALKLNSLMVEELN